MSLAEISVELPRGLRVRQLDSGIDIAEFEHDLAVFHKEHAIVAPLRNAPQLLGDAALSVVNSLSATERRTVFFVNRQEPGEIKHFHKDGKYAIVAHASDGGAFDLAPEANSKEDAEVSYKTLSVNAGDIVYSDRPTLWHRGRNPSTDVRYNLVIQTDLD